MRDIFVGAAYFNSHPHEEDDFIRRSLLGTFIYFNSHPHEEDDSGMSEEEQNAYISTHILTKRMTKKA
ncbi:Uncharacterised protein [[Ruminococcus] torques]|nr:Uncharacterised protein [[Ruminococcus] torques]